MFKEAYDDFKRHKLDQVENNQYAKVLRRKGGAEKKTRVERLTRILSASASVFPRRTKVAKEVVHEAPELDEDDDLCWDRVKWHDMA
ncbi:drs2 neo1 protein, partial [Teratosphaeriaceae sp. CCFEE 6253]